MNKLTNVLALMMVLEMEEVKKNAPLVEKLQSMKAQFEKKGSSTGNLTKEQKKNELIKEEIIKVLTRLDKATQIKELMLEVELKEYSNQKLSALLRQLTSLGLVERIEEKRTALFKIVKKEEEVKEEEEIQEEEIQEEEIQEEVKEEEENLYTEEELALLKEMEEMEENLDQDQE